MPDSQLTGISPADDITMVKRGVLGNQKGKLSPCLAVMTKEAVDEHNSGLVPTPLNSVKV